MKKCISLCAAALAVGICRGATVDLAQTGDLSLTALDNANEYVNGGAELRTLTVTPAANVTNSCLITGNIRLVKAGAKLLALSNGSNAFTGGADVQAGVLEATAAGALGSGQIDVGSASAANQVRFSLPAGSAIANAIHVRASARSFPAISVHGGGNSVANGLQFNGDITADGDLYVFDDASWVPANGQTGGTYSNTQANQYSAIFRGAVTVSGDVFELIPYCKVYCYGKVTAPLFRIGRENTLNTLARAYIYLVNSENDVGTFQCNYCSFIAQKADCFKDAVIDWSHDFSNTAGEAVRGIYNVSGFDQRIAYFKGFKLPERARTCYVVKNSDTVKVPTLTLTGSGVANDSISSDVWLYKDTNPNAAGMYNLCLDAPDFTYALNGSYLGRPNTGVASLTVAHGTLRATGYASFPNATTLNVGTNAVFSLESITNNALSAIVNLSIASGGVFRVDAACGANPFGTVPQMVLSLDSHATFEIPSGLTVSVNELWIDGVRHSGGLYASVVDGDAEQLPQLSGAGRILVADYAPNISSRIWTGAGSDNLFSTAANWDGASLPTFGDGSLLATFATGGTRAEIDSNTSFTGIIFDLPVGTPAFTLARSAGTERVKLGSDGFNLVSTNGSAYTAVVDSPLMFTGNQNWNLGPNTELVVTQAIDTLNGARYKLAVQGATNGSSRVRLSAANTFAGLTVSNCHLSVDSSAGGAFGATNVETLVYATTNGFGNVANSLLTVGGTGAVFDGNMRFNYTVSPFYLLNVPANTTNEFAGLSITSVGNVNRTPYFSFGEGSRTVVNGRMQLTWSPCNLVGKGRVEFRQPVTSGSHVNIGIDTSDRLHVVFESTNNKCYTFVVRNNCTLELLSDYGAMTDNENPGKITAFYGTVLIHGTKQYFFRLQNGGIIRGDAGSQVILGGVYTNNAAGANTWIDAVNCPARFDDATSVSLRYGRYNFTGVSPTTGDLTMTNGWARFTTGSMTNAQTVTVSGSGILELDASDRFGEESVWRVGGGGRVILNAGVRQKCGQLFLTDIDGEKPRRPGLYGSPEAHAANAAVKADSHFEGLGVLPVKGGGTTVIFR
jgi:autotransporter-associated beta strand protein